MGRRSEILDKIRKLAGNKYPKAEVYLFGSRARGDSGKISDWDLLILLNSKKVPFELETQIMDEFYELELETGEIISPLIYSRNDWNRNRTATPLFEKIKREGIRLQ